MSERKVQAALRALAAAQRCDAAVCPDADTLIAFAEGRLPDAEREAVAAKVAACATCAAAVRVALDAASWAEDLAVDLARPSDSTNIHALSRSARPRRRSWLPMALAASLALVFVAGLLLRNAPLDEPLRGHAVVATTPVDGALLRQAPDRLAWPCSAAPAAAKVELLAADATPRWTAAALDCAAMLPAEMEPALPAGEYLWRVKNAAGAVLLGPIAFRIAP